MSSSVLLTQIILWMLIAVVTILVHTRTHRQSVGLIAAYLANMWLIHWPAALTYLFPWYLPIDRNEVVAGFEQSLYGVVGLAIGVVLVGPFLTKALEVPGSQRTRAEPPDGGLPLIYIFVGMFSYLVAGPFLGRLPTLNAIISGTNQLFIVGLCLALWHGWWSKRYSRFALAAIGAGLVPLITIVREGFLSYGAMAIITIVAFLAVFVRPRWALSVAVLFIAYIGFSFYVTYMRDRNEIRSVVWGGQSIDTRVSNLSRSVSTIEWFDPQDPNHLMRVNGRLNQNYLVGAAVINLTEGRREFAKGKTLVDAFQGLIPRALWPDKPVRAGSGTIVTDYTGIGFARGTSVGIGQVLEFYLNFGTIGVIVGFLIFGSLLTLLDTWAAQRLWSGDWLQFTVFFLPGIAMMQAGGSLVEVASSAGASVLAAVIANRYVRNWRSRRAAFRAV